MPTNKIVGPSDSIGDVIWKIRALHSHYGDLPVEITVDERTRAITDLLSNGPYRKYVHVVNFPNAFSALGSMPEVPSLAETIVRELLEDSLRRYHRTRCSNYSPSVQTTDNQSYLVHNQLVTLSSTWNHVSLRQIARQLSSAGLFSAKATDPRFGLVATSSAITNIEMRRRWTQDCCMAFYLQSRFAPSDWRNSIITNAGFHLIPANRRAALNTIRNPKWYRNGSAAKGVAHIFLPEGDEHSRKGLEWDSVGCVAKLRSIKEDDSWQNRKRVGSQALFVKRLIATLLAVRKPWGLLVEDMTAAQIQYVFSSLQLVMPYLMALQWNGKIYDFLAKSIGHWEEAPIPGGCASEIGAQIDAARWMLRLMVSRHGSTLSNIQDADLDKALRSSTFADFRREGTLKSYIQAGMQRLDGMVISPILSSFAKLAPREYADFVPVGVMESESRAADSSLVTLASEFDQFSEDPLEDAIVRFGLVRFAKANLMETDFRKRVGMRRYNAFKVTVDGKESVVWDSYLNLFFHFALLYPALFYPGFKRMVISRHEAMVARGGMSNPPTPEELALEEAFQRVTATDISAAGGNKNAADFVNMLRRQHLSLPDWTALWTIGTTAAVIALSKARLGVKAAINSRGGSEQMNALLGAIDSELFDFLNISFATIVGRMDATGNLVCRADGTELPDALNVMEAFQFSLDENGNETLLPGDHTLKWSEAQELEGIHFAIMALKD